MPAVFTVMSVVSSVWNVVADALASEGGLGRRPRVTSFHQFDRVAARIEAGDGPDAPGLHRRLPVEVDAARPHAFEAPVEVVDLDVELHGRRVRQRLADIETDRRSAVAFEQHEPRRLGRTGHLEVLHVPVTTVCGSRVHTVTFLNLTTRHSSCRHPIYICGSPWSLRRLNVVAHPPHQLCQNATAKPKPTTPVASRIRP